MLISAGGVKVIEVARALFETEAHVSFGDGDGLWLEVKELDPGHGMSYGATLSCLRALQENGLARRHALSCDYWQPVIPEPRWDGEYEAPNGEHIPYYRCDGNLICFDCWTPYNTHPSDEREECLTVLCNGWRVKL